MAWRPCRPHLLESLGGVADAFTRELRHAGVQLRVDADGVSTGAAHEVGPIQDPAATLNSPIDWVRATRKTSSAIRQSFIDQRIETRVRRRIEVVDIGDHPAPGDVHRLGRRALDNSDARDDNPAGAQLVEDHRQQHPPVGQADGPLIETGPYPILPDGVSAHVVTGCY